MTDMKAFAGVARVPFLILPVTLIASGAAAGAYGGAFDLARTVVALVGLVALHVAVNVLNEWSDMRTGIDLETKRTPFSGGSGTLPSGAIPLRTTLVFGLCSAAVGLLAGLWLLAEIGPALLPFMILGAVFVLGYTDALAKTGLGEIAAGLGLGGLPVAGAALVQEGTLGTAAIAAAIPATCMTFNLLLLNEFPDEEADRAGGRKNLVILFGRSNAALVYAAAALATPVSIVAAVLAGVLPAPCLIAVLPSLFLKPALQWAFRRPADAVPVPALGGNVVWNLATNSTLAVGFLLAILL